MRAPFLYIRSSSRTAIISASPSFRFLRLFFSPLFIRCRFTVASSGHQVRNRGGFRESEKVNFLFLHSEVDAHFSGLFFRAPSKWIECLRDYRRSRSPPFLAVECPHPFGGLFFCCCCHFPFEGSNKTGQMGAGQKRKKRDELLIYRKGD